MRKKRSLTVLVNRSYCRCLAFKRSGTPQIKDEDLDLDLDLDFALSAFVVLDPQGRPTRPPRLRTVSGILLGLSRFCVDLSFPTRQSEVFHG